MDSFEISKRSSCAVPLTRPMDDESSDCCSSEMSLELGLDQNGRIAPGVIGQPEYQFRSLQGCLQGDTLNLIGDCKTVFHARDNEETAVYSVGETFFVRADEQNPKSNLEALALDIFKFHASDLKYDPTRSGAEWWTLVLEGDDGIGWHWDKDYALEDRGVNIFPHISTVTYLSSGLPTVVVEKRAPPYSNEDQDTDEVDYTGCAGALAAVSCPKLGKHLSFDGRFLHGTNSELLQLFDSSGNNVRITFLVNIWFNHIPSDADSLPQEVTEKLSTARTAFWNPVIQESKLIALDVDTEACTSVYIPFKALHEGKYNYSLRLPYPMSKKIASEGDTVILKYPMNNAPLVSKV